MKYLGVFLTLYMSAINCDGFPGVGPGLYPLQTAGPYPPIGIRSGLYDVYIPFRDRSSLRGRRGSSFPTGLRGLPYYIGDRDGLFPWSRGNSYPFGGGIYSNPWERRSGPYVWGESRGPYPIGGMGFRYSRIRMSEPYPIRLEGDYSPIDGGFPLGRMGRSFPGIGLGGGFYQFSGRFGSFPWRRSGGPFPLRGIGSRSPFGMGREYPWSRPYSFGSFGGGPFPLAGNMGSYPLSGLGRWSYPRRSQYGSNVFGNFGFRPNPFRGQQYPLGGGLYSLENLSGFSSPWDDRAGLYRYPLEGRSGSYPFGRSGIWNRDDMLRYPPSGGWKGGRKDYY